ncbi:MAG: hypothetical protein ACI3Y9_07175 [Candidatus Cryptobacteroides sp.]
MKPINYFICVLAAAFLASCAVQTVPQQMDEFVEDAEANAEDYTAEDWAQSTEAYKMLVDEYLNSGQEYTEEEKQMAASAIGRYHALLLNNGIALAGGYLKKLGEILPSYLDGFASGIEESGGDIESFFNNLVDEEALEQSAERLNEALENFFGGLDEE